MARKIKVIKERKWDRQVLKEKIREFLDKKGQADELQICEKFGLCLQFACEVIDELVAEGKIAPVKRKK